MKSPEEALRLYHRKAAALTAGRKPLPIPEPAKPGQRVTLHWLLTRWLLARKADVDRGELSINAFLQYRLSVRRLTDAAGMIIADELAPDTVRVLYDRLTDEHGLDFAKRAVAHLRQACRFGQEHDWCGAVRLGPVARLAARDKPKMKWRLYTPDEIRRILDALEEQIADADGRSFPSKVQLHAMILLALNGGYGAKELSDLPRAVVDLKGAKIDYARGKTGAEHVVPLWPETVTSLERAMKLRPDDPLLFRTREGHPWARIEAYTDDEGKLRKRGNDNVGWMFNELVESLALKFARQSFYRLRHLHASVADAIDTNASLVLRGHQIPGASAHYVRIDEARLRELVGELRHRLLKLA